MRMNKMGVVKQNITGILGLRKYGSLSFILALGLFLIVFSWLSLTHTNQIALSVDKTRVIFVNHINDSLTDNESVLNLTLSEMQKTRENSNHLANNIIIELNKTNHEIADIKQLLSYLVNSSQI